MGVDVGKRCPSLVTGRAGTTFFSFPCLYLYGTIRYGAAPSYDTTFYNLASRPNFIPTNNGSGRALDRSHWLVEQTMECLN